jgi:hypothetical protein
MLSQVLKPGTTHQDRQQILNLIDNYSRYDPAEVGQFYDRLFDLFALLGTGLRPRAKMPGTGEATRAEAKPPPESPASAAGQSLAEADAAAWKLGWAARGRYLSERLGANLFHTFPVVDRWLGGVATSIKSIDLRAATYQSAERLTFRLNEYIDKLALFDGARMGNTQIEATAIVGRELAIAIPRGSTTAVQREAMDAARLRAKAFDIDLKFTEF